MYGLSEVILKIHLDVGMFTDTKQRTAPLMANMSAQLTGLGSSLSTTCLAACRRPQSACHTSRQ